MTYARGPRGDYRPGASRGDITGRVYAAQSGQTADADAAKKRTQNALVDGPLVLVTVPGGGVYAVPKAVRAAIFAQAEEQAARGEVSRAR